MKFNDLYFDSENMYALGIESDSGQNYISIPVSNGLVDYEEHYALTADQARNFRHDKEAAIVFKDACCRREHDDLLLQGPGRNRGIPV